MRPAHGSGIFLFSQHLCCNLVPIPAANTPTVAHIQASDTFRYTCTHGLVSQQCLQQEIHSLSNQIPRSNRSVRVCLMIRRQRCFRNLDCWHVLLDSACKEAECLLATKTLPQTVHKDHASKLASRHAPMFAPKHAAEHAPKHAPSLSI